MIKERKEKKGDVVIETLLEGARFCRSLGNEELSRKMLFALDKIKGERVMAGRMKGVLKRIKSNYHYRDSMGRALFTEFIIHVNWVEEVEEILRSFSSDDFE